MSYRKIDRSVERTIVVGDIHGCFRELEKLLAEVSFNGNDALLSVGDFLDRGPDSWACARFFRETPNAWSVLGNHERRLAGTVRGTSQPAWSQRQSLERLPRESWGDWAGWLESLPAVCETPHVLVTHARLDPTRPTESQEPYHTCGVGGPQAAIETDREGVPAWFRGMAFDKPVCIGHVGHERVELVPGRLYALDTGAVHGGQLTAALFPGGELVQVPAERDHFAEAVRLWKEAQFLHDGDVTHWPLVRVARLVESTRPETPGALGEACREALRLTGALDLAGHSQRLRETLRRRFGDPPAAGKHRGEYFLGLVRALPETALRSAATHLMAGRDLSLATFASMKGMTLATVSLGLEKFQAAFSAASLPDGE